MFTEQSTIFVYDAKAQDIEAQMTNNTMDLRLKQKHSAQMIDQINFKYEQEKDLVRNEMDQNPDKVSSEYLELMADLNELKEKESKEVERQEEESTEYQNHIEQENATLESQLKSINADKEALKETLKSNVEKVFGYFQ